MKFSSIGLDKRALEDSRDGPIANHRLVIDETIIVASTNRGLRTINHMDGTYEQMKKELSYF